MQELQMFLLIIVLHKFIQNYTNVEYNEYNETERDVIIKFLQGSLYVFDSLVSMKFFL